VSDSVILDETALRRANPRRGAVLAMPTAVEARAAVAEIKIPYPWWLDRSDPALAEAVRSAVASREPPTDAAAAALVLATLDFERDELFEPVAVWIAEGLGTRGLLGAVTRASVAGRGKGEKLIGYDLMHHERWLAVGRVLRAASDAEYRVVRDDAARLREGRASFQVRAALGVIFPDEPWATDDLRPLAPTRDDGPGLTLAGHLLCANTDFDIADRLIAVMCEKITSTASPPAYVFVDRFGARAEDLLLRAFDANLKDRHDIECEWIAGALACIGSPAIAAVMRGRRGKKVAGAVAAQYAARFPALEAGKAKAPKKEPAPVRFAVLGDFDLWAQEGEGTLVKWKRVQSNAGAFGDWGDLGGGATSAPVGELFQRWSAFRGEGGEYLSIEPSAGGVAVRGVLSAETVAAHGAEILSLFRLGEAAAVYFQGEVVLYSPQAKRGYRLELYERGESELSPIDEAPDRASELRALLGPKKKR
jgi:hypothetical protein